MLKFRESLKLLAPAIMIILASGLRAYADDDDTAEGFVPEISFTQKVLNLGDVARDCGDIKVEFPFRNTGQGPLVLTYVHASCSCMRVQYPREPVAPGDSASISVVFMPSSVSESDFKRGITVRSNAPETIQRLHIIGKLIK